MSSSEDLSDLSPKQRSIFEAYLTNSQKKRTKLAKYINLRQKNEETGEPS